MFAKKLPVVVQAKKKQAIDVMIAKLNTLPPIIDLAVGAVAAIYAIVAAYIQHLPFVAILSAICALCFAFLAINATLREMRGLKYLVATSSEDKIKQMNRHDFEEFLSILFKLSGYQVRSGVNELHRQDDADWILTKRNEVVLVQFNHFDEDSIGMIPLQSLQKAGQIFQATGAIAITNGFFLSDAKQWGLRKGLRLMATQDLIAMARELTGTAVDVPGGPDAKVSVEPTLAHQNDRSCYIFIDFVGLASSLSGFAEIVAQFPLAHLVASTRPLDASLDSLLPDSGREVSGEAERHAAGRYFSIQHYLDLLPEGKTSPWIAIDSEPSQFPSGCSELIAVNPSFGFTAAVKERLHEALGLSMRRLA